MQNAQDDARRSGIERDAERERNTMLSKDVSERDAIIAALRPTAEQVNSVLRLLSTDSTNFFRQKLSLKQQEPNFKLQTKRSENCK